MYNVDGTEYSKEYREYLEACTWKTLTLPPDGVFFKDITVVNDLDAIVIIEQISGIKPFWLLENDVVQRSINDAWIIGLYHSSKELDVAYRAYLLAEIGKEHSLVRFAESKEELEQKFYDR